MKKRIHEWIQRATLAVLVLASAAVAMGCSGPVDESTEGYRRFLAISQVKSSYYTEPKTKEKYPLVQGSLSNLGSQTLIVVEFTFRFKDGANNVIYEEHAYPIFVSDLARPEANQALKPGTKTRFGFKAPKCPPTWQPGAVEIAVTKVVFSKSA